MPIEESRGEMEGPAGRYCWRRVGQGPPLVLINGYAATSDDWDPAFLESLGAGFSVICPDNRGMGETDAGAGPLSVAAMATDVLALLDRLEIESAPIAGWSMGGFVAQQVARAAPERVAALVLLSTDPGGAGAIRCPEEVWAKLIDRGGSAREQARRLIELLFPPPVAEQIDRDFGEVVATARSALSPDALDRQEQAMEGWYGEPADRLTGRPPVPVLAAAGTLDEVVPPANALALASADDDWMARFGGGGHAFMAQEPQRVAALIKAFLAR